MPQACSYQFNFKVEAKHRNQAKHGNNSHVLEDETAMLGDLRESIGWIFSAGSKSRNTWREKKWNEYE